MSMLGALSSTILGTARALNPIVLKLSKLDAKFPPSGEGTTLLSVGVLSDIAADLEELAGSCHRSEIDASTALFCFQSIVNRLASYHDATSEYSCHIYGITRAMVDLRRLFRSASIASRRYANVIAGTSLAIHTSRHKT